MPIFDATLQRTGLLLLALHLLLSPAVAQSLEEVLLREPASKLAALARAEGDAARGAVLFFQPHMACSKCHAAGKPLPIALGPDLAALGKEATDEQLVESVLLPSKIIRKGFESVTVVTTAGESRSGLLVERTPEKLVLRNLERGGELLTLLASEIDESKVNAVSIMPAGQVNQLNSRQQFLDLIRYLFEIRDGGPDRARQLQPPASLLVYTVPEYESRVDHAGLIGDWNDASLKRGEAIYRRVCANCHGTHEKAGSLPTSLRFAEGKFKNGSDPLSLYRTLTHGFGLMAPQAWMVPSQKYDVIQYLREAYLRPHNPSQLAAVDAAYLARLPQGDTRGPEPSRIVPWSAMDYGPSLTHTFEVPGAKHNIAYKGTAVRLDPGAGGVSRGRHWIVFDADTLRAAAAWTGTGTAENNFIDWQGIQFDGAHGVHPRVVGQQAFANGTGPGWANPATGEFRDDQRVKGRDGRAYGPLPREWARYRGLYHHANRVVFSYSVGTTEILESPGLLKTEPIALSTPLQSEARKEAAPAPLFLRTFNIGPRERDLVLQVAEHAGPDARMTLRSGNSVALLASPSSKIAEAGQKPFEFDGNSFLEVSAATAFDLTARDFTIAARVKTRADGTIWSLCPTGPKWAPDGQTFFIRGGRLGFDIGWVGAVTGRSKVSDDQLHDVAMTWERSTRRVRLYVDGTLDGEGTLAAKAALRGGVVRIGFTSPDFPRPSFFKGEMDEVRFYQRRLSEGLEDVAKLSFKDETLIARWLPAEGRGDRVLDTTQYGHDADVRQGTATNPSRPGPILAGFAPATLNAEWTAQDGQLRLRIPAGREALRFTIWLPADAAGLRDEDVSAQPVPEAELDLSAFTHGGPPRWPQTLETQAVPGAEDGPFAADILTAPEANPWLALTRFTGLDFFPDGRIAVCSWDGDVWLVTEKEPGPEASTLVWQRIASGLFQPLGLKIVKGKIHVTCRDQLAVLHDLNADGEIDYYECLNNDHQVTEHFHEFAMGLQTDADGNFYYAKSACHGLAAVVPQHGTLLKVSQDGSRTEILANGFRAANGVCLNPDGSFFVTDQEGFWNPKNRINWVTAGPGGTPRFYGNMLGYHDVTDTSDSAMVPPLCWITNAFDRSPAELLWVDSDRWGPLKGSLLNLSYGYGKVFLVPHERVGDAMQGGMIELPLPTFPTGVMRGRFHPHDGQLYLCGMFAWAGNATHPGGLYRVRATGRPMHLPVGLQAMKTGLKLTFTEPLDRESIDLKNFQVKSWSLKRTADYGSKHYDERAVGISRVTLSSDAKTLLLESSELRPTWGMEIRYSLRAASGAPVHGTIHNTIHRLVD